MKHLIIAVCGAAGFAAAMAAYAPAGHTTTCVGTITAHSLTIAGTVATGTFTVAGAGCELKVGLASYKAANGGSFPANLPQTLFDSKVGVFGPGTYTVTVGVPPCFAQTDLFTGDVVENLAVGSAYGARLLDARLSGSSACATTTTTTTPATTVTTPAQTVTTTVASPPVTTTVEVPGPTTTVTVTGAAQTVTAAPVTTTVTTATPARTVTVKTPARTVTVTRTVVKKVSVKKKAVAKCRPGEKLYRGVCHRIIRGKG